MCLLFETIKVLDGKVCNLTYHQNRVHKHSVVDLLTYILSSVILPLTGLYKLRITYSKANIEGHSLDPYFPKQISSLKILANNTIDYRKKFNDRSCLNAMLSLKGECDDILIIKNNFVSDTSFANILFYDGDKWITPALPLLEGTCRARLLAHKYITAKTISVNDLSCFSKFMLINAMLEFDVQRAIEYTVIDGDIWGKDRTS